MRKQEFYGLKSILGILLLVLFVASLTATSAGAVPSKEKRQDQYNRGYYDDILKVIMMDLLTVLAVNRHGNFPWS